MSNISQLFPLIVKTKQWNQLKELIVLKNDYITAIINNSDKVRIRPKAQQNFENITKILNCQN